MNEIEDLQMRIAFQEDSIGELTRSLLRQERRVAELEQLLDAVRRRLLELEQKPRHDGGANHGEIPPHY